MSELYKVTLEWFEEFQVWSSKENNLTLDRYLVTLGGNQAQTFEIRSLVGRQWILILWGSTSIRLPAIGKIALINCQALY